MQCLSILIILIAIISGARASAAEPVLMIPAQSLAPGIRTTMIEPAPQSREELVRSRAKPIDESIGVCACGLSSTDREAELKPLGKTSVKDVRGRRIAVSVVSFDLALRIFRFLMRQQQIPFGSPQDGCFARAHEMSYVLEKSGIITAKAMATGAFRIESDLLPRGSVSWKYHVAPVVAIDDGTTRRIWALDPSLFSEPVPLEMWLSMLTRHPKAKLNEVYLTSRFILHPKLKNKSFNTWMPEHLKFARNMMKKIAVTPKHSQGPTSQSSAQQQQSTSETAQALRQARQIFPPPETQEIPSKTKP